MDEQDFRILMTLAETGNLTKAAERLFMAQPTLSKRLQNIENDLRVPLFLRSKQGLTLTPAGEEVLKTVRSVSTSFDAMRAQILKGTGVVGGTLSVAVSLDYSRYCLPDVLEAYTRTSLSRWICWFSRSTSWAPPA